MIVPPLITTLGRSDLWPRLGSTNYCHFFDWARPSSGQRADLERLLPLSPLLESHRFYTETDGISSKSLNLVINYKGRAGEDEMKSRIPITSEEVIVRRTRFISWEGLERERGNCEALKDLVCLKLPTVSGQGCRGGGHWLAGWSNCSRIYIFIVCLSKTGYTSLCQRFSLEKIVYSFFYSSIGGRDEW